MTLLPTIRGMAILHKDEVTKIGFETTIETKKHFQEKQEPDIILTSHWPLDEENLLELRILTVYMSRWILQPGYPKVFWKVIKRLQNPQELLELTTLNLPQWVDMSGVFFPGSRRWTP